MACFSGLFTVECRRNVLFLDKETRILPTALGDVELLYDLGAGGGGGKSTQALQSQEYKTEL